MASRLNSRLCSLQKQKITSAFNRNAVFAAKCALFSRPNCMGCSLMGLGLSWLEIGLLCVVIFFSSALLLAPGGVGVMEASVITVLCLLDVTMEQAVSTAVFARIFYSFPSALGAVCVCLGTRRSFFASVQELSQQVQNLRQKKPLLRNR